jgi:cysteine desulfurase/selenocysteine lyase
VTTAPRRLYFDNAATSSPKPESVLRAMADYATRLGGSPGRGAYNESREAGELMWRCRERINTLINGESPSHVIFALNTSDALNLAIKGLLQPYVHARRPAAVITTWMDHNSVLRPLNALAERHPECFKRVLVRPDPESGLLDAQDIRAAIRKHPETKLVAINHVSNVTGTIQPVEAIGRVCREEGVPLLVDAAQSLGHMAVDVRAMSIDLLAFPGHKGLLGPTGTGGLYLRPGMEKLVQSVREGGTGSRSEHDVQPQELPDKYEPGSQNAIGVIGLSEGVRFLMEYEFEGQRGVEAIEAHERALVSQFIQGLHRGGSMELLPGLRLMGPQGVLGRVGVFTVTVDGIGAHELSAVLESEFGVLTRSGVHCAPLAHRLMAEGHESGATPGATRDGLVGGGTRFSVGPFLSVQDVKYATDALAEVCEEIARSGAVG